MLLLDSALTTIHLKQIPNSFRKPSQLLQRLSLIPPRLSGREAGFRIDFSLVDRTRLKRHCPGNELTKTVFEAVAEHLEALVKAADQVEEEPLVDDDDVDLPGLHTGLSQDNANSAAAGV